uniref:Mitochondrial inner membrane protease subunit 2 n=1 Tax=Blastobotrys adeninivorans TaxID=409370 RepID=A0A060T524_BLAAD
MKSRGLRVALISLSWVPVYITFAQAIAYISWIDGPSMKPALNPDRSLGWRDLAIVWKYRVREPGAIKVGDIVLFRSPTHPDRIVTKRVLAVGGDQVQTLPLGGYPKSRVRIPPNHLWVEGDNSTRSVDSNSYGPISSGLVIGKVSGIVFPPSRIGVDLRGGREARI